MIESMVALSVASNGGLNYQTLRDMPIEEFVIVVDSYNKFQKKSNS